MGDAPGDGVAGAGATLASSSAVSGLSTCSLKELRILVSGLPIGTILPSWRSTAILCVDSDNTDLYSLTTASDFCRSRSIRNSLI